MQQMAHDQGELGTVRAAKNFNTIMTHSTISNYSLDDVGPLHDKLFFQLYFSKDRDFTKELLIKCKKNNYKYHRYRGWP